MAQPLVIVTDIFDCAAHVASQAVDQCKTKTGPAAAATGKGAEEIGQDLCRDPRAVVGHAYHDRCVAGAIIGAAPGAMAVTIAGRDGDPGIVAASKSFGGILDEIEQNLDEGILVEQGLRQRRIMSLLDRDVGGEAGACEIERVADQGEYTGAPQIERALCRENFHAIDERRDAIDLAADQRGETC